MVTSLIFVLTLTAMSCIASYHPPPKCYSHHDLSADYKLSHDKNNYPQTEINLVLEQFPAMKEMFKEVVQPSIKAPPNAGVVPLSSVCPHERFTLYSFFYDNKNCYVIYPEVQFITYIQCKNTNNRNCQQCTPYHGQVSKCDEDYSYRSVWAYCIDQHDPHPVPILPKPNPIKPVQTIYPLPPVYPKPVTPIQPVYPQPRPVYPQTRKPIPPVRVYPKPRTEYPVYPINPTPAVDPPQVVPPQVVPPQPYKRIIYPYPSPYKDPWNQVYKPHILEQHRWKRSYPQPRGKIEKMSLYLPYHCGCKTYTC